MEIYILTITIFYILIIVFIICFNKKPVNEIQNNLQYFKNASNNLYCFWTGDNEMSIDRYKCFESLKNSEMNVILITNKNLEKFILKNYPLHEGYQYLSYTHKADYLRTYFMHFYGGGYSDIKMTHFSWIDNLKKLNNSKKFAVGYKETKSTDVCIVKNKYKLVIGNCAYIFKPQSIFTTEWYTKLIKKMDTNLQQLKKFPARTPQEIYSKSYPYPFEWAEILGNIFHPLCYKYHKYLLQTLDLPEFKNYR